MLPLTLIEAILIASPLVAAHHHGSAHEHAHLAAARRATPPPGRNTGNVPRPKLGGVPYGPNIKSCTVPGKVALTFDDGPYTYTAQLLDILAKNSVKATFFINGNNMGGLISDPKNGFRDVVKRMFNEGHQIGSHSYTHANFDKISTQQRKEEIVNNEMAIADIIGVFPTYFRPPYTACERGCETDIAALGYHVANYDLDTKDWEGDYTRARNVFAGGLSSASPKSGSFISLSHDIHEETVVSLVPFMIEQVRKTGYQFTTMGECLGDAPANWYRNALTGAAWDGVKAAEPVPTTSSTPPPPPKTTSSSSTSSSSQSPTGVTNPSSSHPSTSSTAASSSVSSAADASTTPDSDDDHDHDSIRPSGDGESADVPDQAGNAAQTSPGAQGVTPTTGSSPVRDGASRVGLAMAMFVAVWMF
ncbi:peptidoglycan-N-acetylglucosamine deacetylase [Microdochium nivale]|nr:peptidoglycan-N-acetylglucosamine deacetylase [Microdochium nivale]